MQMKWALTTAIIVLTLGGLLLWKGDSPAKQWIKEKFPRSDVSTLEIRHTADEIMETHKGELIKTPSHTYLEPRLTYFPYLWMEVKFAKDMQATEEGISLWSLTEGEMVLDAKTWEKTHGYEDCLLAKADVLEFTVLNSLASHGGALSRESLYQTSSLDGKVIDKTIEKCTRKKLVVTKGELLRLHFDHPRFAPLPFTKIEEEFVTASAKSTKKEAAHYTTADIKKLTENAFGPDFTIRRMNEVYVPVYTISVQNPDGSLLVTHWNALTGKRN